MAEKAVKPRLDDDRLLSMLQELETDSSQYTFGTLRAQRDRAVKGYFQRPYGNEEDGWSQLVTSDIQDTIEWILPELLDIFVSSQDAVVFDPSREADADGAEQATDACNYVFYKQNNGMLVLYTAFKDALMVKNSAIHWRAETKRTKTCVPLRNVTAEEMAFALAEGETEDDFEKDSLQQVEPTPMLDPITGQPMLDELGQPVMEPRYNVKIRRVEERKTIKVEAFEPETLLIKRDWTSPMLDDCPYVARIMEVSLSDLREMGFDDVTADELAGSDEPGNGIEDSIRRERTSETGGDLFLDDEQGVNADDESQTKGYLRIEWVLADKDGDGIAERLEIYRLNDKILSCEECAQVPIATGSPILVQHRWDGMSVAETVADLQLLRTELMRGVVNNAYLANNPRKTVLTDVNGAPKANIDDLLDSRPGGIIRQYQGDAVGMEVTPFVGNQMFSMMEYIDHMREQRTGVSKNQQGLDPNALRPDRTAKEVVITANAAKQRIKLIARIFAETMVKPIFKGILKLLTEGDMEKIAFRLRGSFVELDPNEWRDSYDMTTNVGLGTGDREQQVSVLGAIFQTQMGLAQSPLGPMLITPKQLYNTQAKLMDLTGFKNVNDFLTDPQDAKLPERPQEPPPYQLKVKEMELAAEAQKFQAEAQQEFGRTRMEDERKQRELKAQNAIQALNDARDAARADAELASRERIELAKLQMERERMNHDFQMKQLDVAKAVEVALVGSKAKINDAATDASTGEIAAEVTQ